MMMFAKEPEKMTPEPLNKPIRNYPGVIDHDTSSEFFRVPYQYSCDDGIPSMSVLLAAGMRNRVSFRIRIARYSLYVVHKFYYYYFNLQLY